MTIFPTKKELMEAILEVLKSQRTMTTSAIDASVADKLHLSEEQLTAESSNCSGTEFSYRMRWARTELKQSPFITNPKRGEWTLLSR